MMHGPSLVARAVFAALLCASAGAETLGVKASTSGDCSHEDADAGVLLQIGRVTRSGSIARPAKQEGARQLAATAARRAGVVVETETEGLGEMGMPADRPEGGHKGGLFTAGVNGQDAMFHPRRFSSYYSSFFQVSEISEIGAARRRSIVEGTAFNDTQACSIAAGLLLLMTLAVGLGRLRQRKRRRTFGVRELAKSLPVVTQIADKTPSPGALVRLCGRVVAKESERTLVAPISGRACVLYSASTAHTRLDEVHQPPVAFEAASLDFDVEIASGQRVAVSGRDVVLFEMDAGAFERSLHLSEAPEEWRSFVRSRAILSGGNADCARRVGELVFRECALLDGAVVSCLGEVAQDCQGQLSLCPWRPSMDAEVRRCGRRSVSAAQCAERLADRVFVSDGAI